MGIKAFAGSTIMGDGRVALILDVLGVAQSSKVVTDNRDRAVADNGTLAAGAAAEKQTMLLFRCGPDGCLAMELSLVARLEEFKASAIEKAGNRQVVQYRGEIMPLIRISEALRIPAEEPLEMAWTLSKWSSIPNKATASDWWWTISWTSWKKAASSLNNPPNAADC